MALYTIVWCSLYTEITALFSENTGTVHNCVVLSLYIEITALFSEKTGAIHNYVVLYIEIAALLALKI